MTHEFITLLRTENLDLYVSYQLWNHAPTRFKVQREKWIYLGSNGWAIKAETFDLRSRIIDLVGAENVPTYPSEYAEFKKEKGTWVPIRWIMSNDLDN